jgi:hypothetical protein
MVGRLRMFENTVLRRIVGPKGVEVTGEWRKLHNEKINDIHVYSPPNIVRVIKSRRMRQEGARSAYGGKTRRVQGFGGET